MRIRAIKRLVLRQQSALVAFGNFLRGGLLRHNARLPLLNKLPRRGGVRSKRQILITITAHRKDQRDSSQKHVGALDTHWPMSRSQTPLNFDWNPPARKTVVRERAHFFFWGAEGARPLPVAGD